MLSLIQPRYCNEQAVTERARNCNGPGLETSRMIQPNKYDIRLPWSKYGFDMTSTDVSSPELFLDIRRLAESTRKSDIYVTRLWSVSSPIVRRVRAGCQ